MLYWAYSAVLTLAGLLLLPIAPLLFLVGERFRSGLSQRFGFYPREVRSAVSGSRPIWIHAASVGEALSAGPLTKSLRERFPGRKIIVSVFTHTGKQMASQVTAADAVIFLPLDHPWIVRRALAVFEPAALIFLEREIWPNLLRCAHRRGIPTVLLSGRLSARALKKYSFFRLFFEKVVNQFSVLGMQTPEDGARISHLGVDPDKISVTGNLKKASIPADQVEPGRASTRGEKRNPKGCLLVVGSTHRGEEEILLEVFLSLKKKLSGFSDGPGSAASAAF